ncbi:MAG: HAD hydrolase family protein [Bdellovibrionota bacterium]|nr:HAD hydrolase family protein [Bdellovibrionota bacterium]
MQDLKEIATKLKDKIDKIKVMAFDIDGVLTTGHIWYSENEGFNRFSHTSDGYGLKMMMRAGYKVGVISGGDSLGVKKRFRDNLKLDFCYFGNEDKREAYKEVLAMGYKDEEILYMGDEFFDAPLLKKAGLGITVPHASQEVKKFADYITNKEGGQGAVREIIDIVRYAKDIYPEVVDFDGAVINFKN